MDNMYREGRRRGDKGFVWTCKGEEEMLEDDMGGRGLRINKRRFALNSNW